jgi:hypothetical protein
LFRGADCDADPYLVMAVSKKTTLKFLYGGVQSEEFKRDRG